MSQDDREWFHQDRARREKLVWNGKAGEMEFDHAKRNRRWRWPYRLRPGLPWWLVEWMRLGAFMAVLAVLWMLWERFGKGLLS
jgi:hypothetical protein